MIIVMESVIVIETCLQHANITRRWRGRPWWLLHHWGMASDDGSSVEGKSNQRASSFQQMQLVSCMKYKINNITFGIGSSPLEWTLQWKPLPRMQGSRSGNEHCPELPAHLCVWGTGAVSEREEIFPLAFGAPNCPRDAASNCTAAALE